jgi:hypothetical protein
MVNGASFVYADFLPRGLTDAVDTSPATICGVDSFLFSVITTYKAYKDTLKPANSGPDALAFDSGGLTPGPGFVTAAFPPLQLNLAHKYQGILTTNLTNKVCRTFISAIMQEITHAFTRTTGTEEKK